MVTKGFFSSLSPVQQEAALAYDGPENHGPDFFAENANKSEHHAESAYCSDHIVDANKMVSAGLPSEEEIHVAMFEAQRAFRAVRDADLAKQGYWPDRSPAPLDVLARAILDLIRPAFEAKEREIERWRRRWLSAEAELQSTEAKIAQAVADEREACAQIAEDKAHTLDFRARATIASAIRARSAAAMGEKR
jgi:hypothetical protein